MADEQIHIHADRVGGSEPGPVHNAAQQRQNLAEIIEREEGARRDAIWNTEQERASRAHWDSQLRLHVERALLLFADPRLPDHEERCRVLDHLRHALADAKAQLWDR